MPRSTPQKPGLPFTLSATGSKLLIEVFYEFSPIHPIFCSALCDHLVYALILIFLISGASRWTNPLNGLSMAVSCEQLTFRPSRSGSVISPTPLQATASESALARALQKRPNQKAKVEPVLRLRPPREVTRVPCRRYLINVGFVCRLLSLEGSTRRSSPFSSGGRLSRARPKPSLSDSVDLADKNILRLPF